MRLIISTCLSMLLLTGCAVKLSDAEKTQIVDQFVEQQALQNKHSINAFRLDSWTSINDEYLVLRSSPFKPYLLKLFSRCSSLDTSPALVIKSRIPNTLSEGFDGIYTPNQPPYKCTISKIYPLTRDQYQMLENQLQLATEEKRQASMELEEVVDS